MHVRMCITHTHTQSQINIFLPDPSLIHPQCIFQTPSLIILLFTYNQFLLVCGLSSTNLIDHQIFAEHEGLGPL